jgi:exoribonuclease-2
MRRAGSERLSRSAAGPLRRSQSQADDLQPETLNPDSLALWYAMDDTSNEHRSLLRQIARREMLDRGFDADFPPPVLSELAQMHSAPVPASGMRDLRDLMWVSIDNDDSLDLDQLSVCEKLPDGTVKMLVAVADVDGLVRAASATDAHAAHNTTSVYTPAEVFPMLPEKLSTGLTSLNADEDRAAIVVEMRLDASAALVGSDVYQAIVRNHAKLAYDSVSAWLDGGGPEPQAMAAAPGAGDQVRAQDAVAQQLDLVRHHAGALNFETIETHAVFDGDTIRDLQPQPRNLARALIENLMIAANGVSARFLDSHGRSSIRRVVRSPERWDRIVALARTDGETLPPAPDARALNAFLLKRQVADPVRFPDLSLAVIKLLGRGEYVLERPGEQAPGHFGLAVQDYTHSTAPNRRYPDLLTERLLKAALAGSPPPYSDADLEALASHCTTKEDDANKVERMTRKAAAAMMLEPRVGERFDGIVTGASDKGTWVRILHPPVEGRLIAGYRGADVGDRLRVKLVHTDVERGFIDFARS